MTPVLSLLLQTRRGLLFIPEDDFYTRTALTRTGDYSPGELRLLEALLRPGDTVIDVGANVGIMSITFARRVGRTGRVVSLEPQRSLFQMLCANAVVNGLTNIEAHWAGAGHGAGQMWIEPLDPATRNYGGRRLRADHIVDAETTRVIALDSLSLSSCQLLKIDVEGMEEEVLAGASRVLDLNPIIYCENSFWTAADGRLRSARLIEFLFERGYRVFWHCPSIVECSSDPAEAVLRDGGSMNVLAIRETRRLRFDPELQIAYELEEIESPNQLIIPRWVATAQITRCTLGDQPWAAVRKCVDGQIPDAVEVTVRAILAAFNAAAARASIPDRLVAGTAAAWSLADLWLLHFDRVDRWTTSVVVNGMVPGGFVAFLKERFDVLNANDHEKLDACLTRDRNLLYFVGPGYDPAILRSGKLIQVYESPSGTAAPHGWQAGNGFSFSVLRSK